MPSTPKDFAARVNSTASAVELAPEPANTRHLIITILTTSTEHL